MQDIEIRPKKRALRRQQKKRMKGRAKKVGKLWGIKEDELDEFAGKFCNNIKRCSCWACGNLRKYLGEETKQERLARLKEAEELPDKEEDNRLEEWYWLLDLEKFEDDDLMGVFNWEKVL